MSVAAAIGWIVVIVYVGALVKFRERWIIALLAIALLAAILGVAQRQAEEALPIAVRAVTDRVRELHREWIEFSADPDLTGYERSTVRMCASDVARLLDRIDAEMGVLR